MITKEQAKKVLEIIDCAAAAARAAVYAAKAAADAGKDFDTELSWYCEEVVKILIDMNVPGVQFLDLT